MFNIPCVLRSPLATAFLILLGAVAFADKAMVLDSLLDLERTTKVDTTRVILLNKICWEYRVTGDYKKGFDYGERALALAENIGFKKGIALTHNNIGLLYYNQGNYSEALSKHQKSLKIFEEIQQPPGISSAQNNIGTVLMARGDHEQALEYYLKSLKIRQYLKNETEIGKSYHNIGVVYSTQGDYANALKYYLQGLEIHERKDEPWIMAHYYQSIGSVYLMQGNNTDALKYYLKSLNTYRVLEDKRGMLYALVGTGWIYTEQKEYDIALEQYLESSKLAEAIGDKLGIAEAYRSMGTLYIELAKAFDNRDTTATKTDLPLKGDEVRLLDSAQYYLIKAITIQRDLGNKLILARCLGALGRVFQIQKNWQESILIYSEALSVAEEIGVLPEQQVSHEALSIAYEQLSNFDKGLYHQKMQSSLKDSILNEENNKQIVEMQTKYDTEKKERENVELLAKTEIQGLQLSRRNYTIFGLSGFAIFLLIIGLLVINQNKLKAKHKRVALEQDALRLEQQLLRSQMNPHFIFNSLNAIQSYLFENKAEDAADFLSNFAKLMRLILENSRLEYISLEKEIKFLEYYLSLQQLRFENSFEFAIHASEDLDIETTAIPPMLAQPFLENAIEHGLTIKDTAGRIVVNFKREADLLIFSVEDNGVGIDENTKIEGHESFATEITRDRLAILNKGRRKEINLQIAKVNNATTEATGTIVTFQIPFQMVGLDKRST